jgi:hypothetical protein
MSIHQGGKACLLSTHDAEQLEKYGIVPKCVDHRHLRKTAAEAMVHERLLRRITVPGPDRFVWIRVQHLRVICGVMQLIDGDVPGRRGKAKRGKYAIQAVGAHERRQNVREINAEPRGEQNESSGTA